MENGSNAEGRDPSGFLTEIIGAPVTVKLNSGIVYKGKSQQQLVVLISLIVFSRRTAIC
jgi:hypothetical protein